MFMFITSVYWTATLLQLAREFFFKDLVSMTAAWCEAADGPVHWPSHFHLLGHLCKPHHQLDRQNIVCQTVK